jgi:hypothetical protein
MSSAANEAAPNTNPAKIPSPKLAAARFIDSSQMADRPSKFFQVCGGGSALVNGGRMAQRAALRETFG